MDLLFTSFGVEPELVSAAGPLEVLERVAVPVATTSHLIALKVLSKDPVTRPQDLVDARSLLAIASSSELEEARNLRSRIEERGSHRGRALLHGLDALLEPS